MIAAPGLLANETERAPIGDPGHDSNAFRADMRKRGMFPVVASNPERKSMRPNRLHLYAKRYLVAPALDD